MLLPTNELSTNSRIMVRKINRRTDFQKWHSNSSSKVKGCRCGNSGHKTEACFSRSDTTCYRCRKRGHKVDICIYRQYKCYECGKMGHNPVACRSKNAEKNNIRYADHENFNRQSDDKVVHIHVTRSNDVGRPIMLQVVITNCFLSMELDTGSRHTLIPSWFWKKAGTQMNTLTV